MKLLIFGSLVFLVLFSSCTTTQVKTDKDGKKDQANDKIFERLERHHFGRSGI